jgi:hypothetical protein
MTFAERKKLVIENRKKLVNSQVTTKINKNSNKELEENVIKQLSNIHDPLLITKEMIKKEIKKIINERLINSKNKRKESLIKHHSLLKNKLLVKNYEDKDALSIEIKLLSNVK